MQPLLYLACACLSLAHAAEPDPATLVRAYTRVFAVKGGAPWSTWTPL